MNEANTRLVPNYCKPALTQGLGRSRYEAQAKDRFILAAIFLDSDYLPFRVQCKDVDPIVDELP